MDAEDAAELAAESPPPSLPSIEEVEDATPQTTNNSLGMDAATIMAVLPDIDVLVIDFPR